MYIYTHIFKLYLLLTSAPLTALNQGVITATASSSSDRPSTPTLPPQMSQQYIGSCHLLKSFWRFFSRPYKACGDLTLLLTIFPLASLVPWSHGTVYYLPKFRCSLCFSVLSRIFFPSPFVPRLFLLKLSISIVHYFFTDASLPRNSTLRYLPPPNENIFPPKNLYMNIYSCFIHNSPKLK